uniref:RING-type domain-containing protein n=1 Tax=Macrostomum lignano TaxID=282301 RepID=A0A1I8FAG2_9PLAT
MGGLFHGLMDTASSLTPTIRRSASSRSAAAAVVNSGAGSAGANLSAGLEMPPPPSVGVDSSVSVPAVASSSSLSSMNSPAASVSASNSAHNSMTTLAVSSAMSASASSIALRHSSSNSSAAAANRRSSSSRQRFFLSAVRRPGLALSPGLPTRPSLGHFVVKWPAIQERQDFCENFTLPSECQPAVQAGAAAPVQLGQCRTHGGFRPAAAAQFDTNSLFAEIKSYGAELEYSRQLSEGGATVALAVESVLNLRLNSRRRTSELISMCSDANLSVRRRRHRSRRRSQQHGLALNVSIPPAVPSSLRDPFASLRRRRSAPSGPVDSPAGVHGDAGSGGIVESPAVSRRAVLFSTGATAPTESITTRGATSSPPPAAGDGGSVDDDTNGTNANRPTVPLFEFDAIGTEEPPVAPAPLAVYDEDDEDEEIGNGVAGATALATPSAATAAASEGAVGGATRASLQSPGVSRSQSLYRMYRPYTEAESCARSAAASRPWARWILRDRVGPAPRLPHTPSLLAMQNDNEAAAVASQFSMESQLASEIGLPSLLPHLPCAKLPVDVMHECIKLQMEQKMDPTSLSLTSLGS